jgi:hypothetical protein
MAKGYEHSAVSLDHEDVVFGKKNSFALTACQ